ncbi:hypothetical protein IRZ48_13465 [Pseudomonas fulva]|uniref:NEL-type E3 ubiquitin ligase domain-containing protein n=2 Tax=Pseudomonas fulva TaxID=47880 RepID=UPI0018A9EBB7|nr:NEL-type E3 ubiquitin ligase domain-containing protein [Pseudomonas fulva]MBF8637725.1 hypothetical protein [Pseudomonas fulva]MBF8689614.1 hypothetical protein [Pseudomonas fulva]
MMVSLVTPSNHTDSFIDKQLPSWLHAASLEQIQSLRKRVEENRWVEQRLEAMFKRLLSPDSFARQTLTTAIKQKLGVSVELAHTLWRERLDYYSMLGGEGLRDHYTFHPAITHLMQNFPAGSSFDARSGIISGAHGMSPNAPLLVDSAKLAGVCRSVDTGKRYQAYLQTFFDDAAVTLLAQSVRKRVALAMELAGIRGEVPESDVTSFEYTLGEVPVPDPRHPTVVPKHLHVLGHAMVGGLIFERSNDSSGGSADPAGGVLLYLPHQPLRQFANLTSLNAHLASLFRQPEHASCLLGQVAADARIAFQAALKKRLSDAVPDLEVTGKVARALLFPEMAELQVARIKADARFLLVPVADVDRLQRLERLRTLEQVGLNLTQMAALFVPQLGALMLAATVTEVLSEVMAAVHDWSRGHQHEALEHVLGVAETVAVTALMATGGEAVARGFKRSAFVDEMMPVEQEDGASRLWAEDLKPYRAVGVPRQAMRGRDGLFRHGDTHWWLHEGNYYEVSRKTESHPWRLVRNDGKPGFAPALSWNGEQGWRLKWQRPQMWEGERALLGHLWPVPVELDSARLTQILNVADVDQTSLRRLVGEQRALPVSLRDTLERFEADARIDSFFATFTDDHGSGDPRLLQWCVGALTEPQREPSSLTASMLAHAPTLRQGLMSHLTDELVLSPEAAAIRRVFPGLPARYAEDVIANASADQRQRLLERGRIDLALAEKARLALQEARACRALQSLYLNNAYHPDMPSLVFGLLRTEPAWPLACNVQIRESSPTGRVMAELYPVNDSAQVKMLVWKQGQVSLYEHGQLSSDSLSGPGGLLEKLWQLLPEAELERFGWSGPNGVQQMRASLQSRLPARREAVQELMGMQVHQPTFRAPARLADRRFGYLLSGRASANHLAERTLQDRVRSLFPGFSAQNLERFLQVLQEQPGSPFTVLLELENDYSRLDLTLEQWTAQPAAAADVALRRSVADELRRCWRFQGYAGRRHANGDQGMALSLSGIGVGELPDLSAAQGFSHVSELSLVNMRLTDLPGEFLAPFRGILTLNLDNNALTQLPQGLSQLRELTELTLSRNSLSIGDAGFRLLAGIPRLSVLDLSDNTIGAIPIEMNRLPRLRQLGLRRTGLTQVPTHLDQAVSLEYVDLRDNHIAELPLSLRAQRTRWRNRLALVGNPLPALYRDLWIDASRTSASDSSPDGDAYHFNQWLERLDPTQRASRTAQWNRLLNESGSEDFFRLVGELTDTSDFRLARDDLEARLWALMDRIESNTALRELMFTLASEPRTCVDSVISSFGWLETRLLSASLEAGAGDQAEGQLLNLARRFFRLDRVEAYARRDMSSRGASGSEVDQVEVSLAYRVGLASTLELPGQPITMQFRTIAGVTEQHLAEAEAAVREAEASDELAVDISERGFWFEYLQRQHQAMFEQVREPFVQQMEALYEGRESLTDADYDAQARSIAKASDEAVKAKALELTRQSLAREGGQPQEQ